MSVLVQGNVRFAMFRMAFPMLAGTFAMTAYNLADTWFVAKLGTLPLAAMGFSFPVIMLLTFTAGGIGTGVTTLVSHAVGRHDRETAARLATHGILLTMLCAGALSLLGYISIRPVFTMLGADAATLPLIRDFMGTWYTGAVFMALPMMGNGILITLGDSRSASRFMLLGPALNVILDPIMIFGWMGFPALGIFGAALATVLAQAASTVWLFHLLMNKHGLVSVTALRSGGVLDSWRRILWFAIPSVISMMLMPLSSAVITSLVSRFGAEAVAACGAASRIEMFAFVIPMALGISLTPFVSQNFGAGRLDRIREAKDLAYTFALAYGAVIAGVFFVAAPLLAWVFTDDPKVTDTLVAYIRTISFGYGMMEVHRYSGFLMTGVQRPILATVLNVFRVLVLLLPLSWLGATYGGISGLFAGRLVTDLVAGTVGVFWVSRILRSMAATSALHPAP